MEEEEESKTNNEDGTQRSDSGEAPEVSRSCATSTNWLLSDGEAFCCKQQQNTTIVKFTKPLYPRYYQAFILQVIEVFRSVPDVSMDTSQLPIQLLSVDHLSVQAGLSAELCTCGLPFQMNH